MPDAYWTNFAAQQKKKAFVCPSCGAGTDVHIHRLGKCDACRKKPTPPERSTCTCGEVFMPTVHRQLRCPDCVGERSETKGADVRTRLSDGSNDGEA